MNPAYSVIFLTTLIGAAQGLFIALWGADLAGVARVDGGRSFLLSGGVLALLLTAMFMRRRVPT